jgi:hypothetical protein
MRMLEFSGIHYGAIALAWLINVVVGAFWYSPAAFGKRWKAHTGIDLLKIPEKEATRTIGFVAFSAVLQAVTLAIIVNSLGLMSAVDGLLTGLVLWLGFVAATTVGVTLYSRRSWKFWWLNSSYFLLVMTVNSVILTIWR